MLFEVSVTTQSNILSRSTKIGSFSFTTEAHKTLNFSRGVISVEELLHSTNEESLINLKSENVIDVRRITIRRNDQILPTKYIFLAFNSPNLPNRMKSAYLSCFFRPYIPNHLRCFWCQR